MVTPALAAVVYAVAGFVGTGQVEMINQEDARVVVLPAPVLDGSTSVETALARRGSVREYSGRALGLKEVGQLLWAAQGITDGGRRTAPSAGALYPLELHVLAGNVDGLEAGLYRYRPQGHELVWTADEDRRAALASAALGQEQVSAAPLVLVIAGVIERTAAKYGDRAERYVQMEVGAAAENIYLQAGALGLGTVFVGAFRDGGVARVLGLGEGESAYAILPVGWPGG
jgi:SagB-type dehydrogenase family enzyme